MAEIKYEAALAERERISKLLIDHVLQMANTPSESWTESIAIKVDALNVAIALIKGENK
jgi:hypothetical protein